MPISLDRQYDQETTLPKFINNKKKSFYVKQKKRGRAKKKECILNKTEFIDFFST